jgi:hypothetical protein
MGRNYLRHRRGDAARRRWLQLPPPDPRFASNNSVEIPADTRVSRTALADQ